MLLTISDKGYFNLRIVQGSADLINFVASNFKIFCRA